MGEGALAVALELQEHEPEALIQWMVADEDEHARALQLGFTPVYRSSWRGFWSTLRSGQIVVTHGLGDVNRYGVFGAFVVQLWHGAPLKRLHLDSPVTTELAAPGFFQALLNRMYRAGAREVDLYVAGSALAAGRLRSAFRVAPGKVRVLGDPRDDRLAECVADEQRLQRSRAEVLNLIDAHSSDPGRLILYAPTWRDGDQDPAIPHAQEIARIQETLQRLNASLVIRSHPLGEGDYAELLGSRVYALPATKLKDVTPLLGAFDAVITDYSSVAIDFSLTGRPIVWFAPDLDQYFATRGLYEPLEVTSGGRVAHSWAEALSRLFDVLQVGSAAHGAARSNTLALSRRFFAHPTGGAAARVISTIRRLQAPEQELVPDGAVFFESFYGRQVGCNPLALDREVAKRFPDVPRLWSVTREEQRVPDGATPLLVGGREWLAARKRARLLIVNDWLRYGFRRRRGQTVLQTWHGTMMKHLALGRPHVGLRTRIAIRRESRRWTLLLSQNPHSTSEFRRSYAYSGEILETGYPRDDRLARVVVGDERNPIEVLIARERLGVPRAHHVLVYAPTWRDRGASPLDASGLKTLVDDLGEGWTVVVRGHTRSSSLGHLGVEHENIIDASGHDDVNDVIIAATVLVTDYSSIMFDASVARVPQLFFTPDLEDYRDRERGFTFDFASEAPGPLLTQASDIASHALELAERGDSAAWVREYVARSAAWRERFNPHDDGGAARRVVDDLVARGALSSAA